VQPSVTIRKTDTPAGDATVVAATVRVPRSYFVSMYRSANTSAGSDVSDALLQPLVDLELSKIKDDVMMCTGLTLDEKVRVGTYWDAMPMLTGAGTPAEAGAFSLSVTSYAKELAVGVLAVVSLFMMMMMVRKGAVAPAMLPPPQATMPNMLARGEDVAGEASEGGPAMDGMELDDDVIRTQQMIEQVSTMVKENPDAAAGLVKRWMNK